MDSFEREEERKQKSLEERHGDRIKQQQDQYWNDLEYRTVATCSKEQEDRALADELYALKKLRENFKK
ncbi:MAG: hypothetical protein M3044_06630 [Thermoproteota archaeon]|nr:hypothetical protein [Thermoproteota archaeon]